MKLEQVDIKSSRALAREAKKLYGSAFPQKERIPWWILRRGSQVSAWCEAGAFRGFTAAVEVPGLYFLAFFAIAPQCRGKGYGSAILQQLQQTQGAVALNVEPLDEECDNYAQRVSRLAFYKKNGLTDTGWDVWEVGGRFWILCTGTLDVAAYKQVFRKASRGRWDVKMERRK